MSNSTMLTAGLMVASIASVFGQGAASPSEKKPTFEVASIKPSTGDGGGWSTSGGRQTIIGTTAGVLIMSAYNLHQYEIHGGPAWLHTDRLDVIAQAEGKPTAQESQLMMQSLLEERFALKAHRETREAPVYRLILARKDGKLGSQLLKSDSECGTPPPPSVPWAVSACSMRMGPGELIMGARPFSGLLSTLESLIDRRIIDETGLNGRFDVKLDWSRGPKDVDRPSVFTAIQEQLGLKLESARGPVTVLVIDSISRPTPD